MVISYKVLKPFPVQWQKTEVKVGEIFQVFAADTWHKVGGGYYQIGPPQAAQPDFSGARLEWLRKNGYIQ